MNRIYRVIWSKTHNTWIAVSELAKSQVGGRGAITKINPVSAEMEQPVIHSTYSLKLNFKPLMLALMTLMGSGQAWASICDIDGTIGGNQTDQSDFSCGIGNRALGNEYNSSVGTLNTTVGVSNNAIGYSNAAQGERSSAVGAENTAIGTANTVIGGSSGANYRTYTVDPNTGLINSVNGIPVMGTGSAPATITSVNGIELNQNVKASLNYSLIGGGSVAVGNNNNLLGTQSIILGNNSAGVGFNNTIFADNASVLGSNSHVTANNATALGNDSIADEENTISVGRKDAEKRITNVAAGTKATDAVNFQQLQNAIALSNTDSTPQFQSNGSNAAQIATSANKALAMGDGAKVGENADESIAIGSGAQANGVQSLSVGTGNIVNGSHSGAFGDPNTVNGNASFEVGGEEGLDIVEEFYSDESKPQQQSESAHDLNHVQDIQKGLQQSVQALN